jgi:ABC-type branched-subunit amino acid transport system permease subunit
VGVIIVIVVLLMPKGIVGTLGHRSKGKLQISK